MRIIAMARKKAAAGPAPDGNTGDGRPESKDRHGFEKTQTRLISGARSPNEDMRFEALSQLLAKYGAPLKNYLMASFMWKFRVNEGWIEDCLQSFVWDKVMKRKLIEVWNRERPRTILTVPMRT